jgi:hypothetical protein
MYVLTGCKWLGLSGLEAVQSDQLMLIIIVINEVSVELRFRLSINVLEVINLPLLIKREIDPHRNGYRQSSITPRIDYTGNVCL